MKKAPNSPVIIWLTRKLTKAVVNKSKPNVFPIIMIVINTTAAKPYIRELYPLSETASIGLRVKPENV
jgi:hypothetical protein